MSETGLKSRKDSWVGVCMDSYWSGQEKEERKENSLYGSTSNCNQCINGGQDFFYGAGAIPEPKLYVRELKINNTTK